MGGYSCPIRSNGEFAASPRHKTLESPRQPHCNPTHASIVPANENCPMIAWESGVSGPRHILFDACRGGRGIIRQVPTSTTAVNMHPKALIVALLLVFSVSFAVAADSQAPSDQQKKLNDAPTVLKEFSNMSEGAPQSLRENA